MRKLKIPQVAKTAVRIYVECARDFVNTPEYTKTILSYAECVKKYSRRYPKYIPFEINKMPEGKVEEADVDIVLKVYEQKFAKKDSIGRKYYTVIKENANYRCPICGGGKIKHLDHFLPKSKYPLLCVTPMNLIPLCRDCNTDKGIAFSKDYYEIPFHPYFETMDDICVECDVTFYSDGTFLVKYKNGYDKLKNVNMWKKYEAHMRIHDLANTFCARAHEEMENIRTYYGNLLGDRENIKKSFFENKKSAEDSDINSWKAALYRALERQYDEFCDWLEHAEDDE